MLTKCPHCRHELASAVRLCPGCGAVVRSSERFQSLGERQTADDAGDSTLAARTVVMRDDVEEQLSTIEQGSFEPLVFDESAGGASAETIDARPTPLPAELAIDPQTAALVQLAADGTPVSVRALERPYYSIGRENCKIRIDDPRVSRFHLSLVKLGTRWVVINVTDRKSMQIGGWKLRQKTLEAGDAIRIGETWLVFIPEATDETVTGDGTKALPVTSTSLTDVETLESLNEDEDEAALLVLQAGSREISRTSSRTLMFGGHASCDVITGGPGAAPFRCFIDWAIDGPTIVSLGLPVVLNGRPVNSALLADGDRLQIDLAEFRVELHGDPTAPSRARLARMRQVHRSVCVTAFYGPHLGASWSMTPSRWVTIGRKESCGIAVPKDRRVADVQTEGVVVLESIRNPASRAIVRFRDVVGNLSTLINRSPVEGIASARVGDVIQFGTRKRVSPTALLLHYPLTAGSWLPEGELS